MSSDFVPNSFQTPNAYIDQFMDALSPAEFKVLIYFVRRIFGFQKRQDRVALSQLCSGLVARDGRVLDRGTGLSEDACRDAVRSLIAFRLLLAGDRTNDGTLYSLQLDSSKVDRAAMDARRLSVRQSYQNRAPAPVTWSAQPDLFDLSAGGGSQGGSLPATSGGGLEPTSGGGLPATSGGGLPATHNTQETHLENKGNPNMGAPRLRKTDAKIKGDLVDGMLQAAPSQSGQLDLAEFSEDVRPVFQMMFDLWGVIPPASSARSSMGGLWQREARQVINACGEFGLVLLHDIRAADDSFVPARPGSLIGWCIPAAARRRKAPAAAAVDVPPAGYGADGRRLRQAPRGVKAS